MRLAELIDTLTALYEQYGDVRVVIPGNGPVRDIEFVGKLTFVGVEQLILIE